MKHKPARISTTKILVTRMTDNPAVARTTKMLVRGAPIERARPASLPSGRILAGGIETKETTSNIVAKAAITHTAEAMSFQRKDRDFENQPWCAIFCANYRRLASALV